MVENSYMGADNQTQVSQKRIQYSQPMSHLSSPFGVYLSTQHNLQPPGKRVSVRHCLHQVGLWASTRVVGGGQVVSVLIVLTEMRSPTDFGRPQTSNCIKTEQSELCAGTHASAFCLILTESVKTASSFCHLYFRAMPGTVS